ncbi:MAG TPA: SRPBCC family protein [Noviherbaspirillum sp.]|nr:SRPBCC family protein [Noviherbaspirillum sp.]
MPVDVLCAATIARPREVVAAFVANPDNAPAWHVNIRSVEWKTAPPLRVGSRIAFVARFLGAHLTYIYEVTEFVPGKRLVMRTTADPFPMETIYTWTPAAAGTTRMILRHRGGPSGLARLLTPAIGAAMRYANRKDLARLKKLLEQQVPAGGASS